MVVMLSSISVPICNHFHTRRANTSKMTSFLEGVHLFCPSFMGTPLTQRHQILSRNTRNTMLS